MGTWGHRNLENDYALDELASRSDALVGAMLRRAQGRASREADEYDHTTLFVELELAFALDAADLLPARFPDPAAVRALAASFITGWDEYIDELSPQGDFKQQRRQTILDSFERFAAICERHEGTGPLPPAEAPTPGPAAKPKPTARLSAKPKPPERSAKPTAGSAKPPRRRT